MKRERNDNTEESCTSSKRQKPPVEKDGNLCALHDEYDNFLYNNVMQYINANEDVNNLIQSILSSVRVPKGMVTCAARRIKGEASEIKRLIRGKMKDKAGFEHWIEFVNGNFDNFALNIRNDLKGKGKKTG